MQSTLLHKKYTIASLKLQIISGKKYKNSSYILSLDTNIMW